MSPFPRTHWFWMCAGNMSFRTRWTTKCNKQHDVAGGDMIYRVGILINIHIIWKIMNNNNYGHILASVPRRVNMNWVVVSQVMLMIVLVVPVHSNGNIMTLTKYSSLTSPEVVKMNNLSGISGEDFIKMTFPFECIGAIFVVMLCVNTFQYTLI